MRYKGARRIREILARSEKSISMRVIVEAVMSEVTRAVSSGGTRWLMRGIL